MAVVLLKSELLLYPALQVWLELSLYNVIVVVR